MTSATQTGIGLVRSPERGPNCCCRVTSADRATAPRSAAISHRGGRAKRRSSEDRAGFRDHEISVELSEMTGDRLPAVGVG